jgi:hypothetical protein
MEHPQTANYTPKEISIKFFECLKNSNPNPSSKPLFEFLGIEKMA